MNFSRFFLQLGLSLPFERFLVLKRYLQFGFLLLIKNYRQSIPHQHPLKYKSNEMFDLFVLKGFFLVHRLFFYLIWVLNLKHNLQKHFCLEILLIWSFSFFSSFLSFPLVLKMLSVFLSFKLLYKIKGLKFLLSSLQTILCRILLQSIGDFSDITLDFHW